MPSLVANILGLILLSGCQTDTVRVGNIDFVAHQIQVDGPDVASGELNGDGHVDLVGGGEPLVIFLGDGTGALTRWSQIAGGENPTDINLVDFDSDSHLDILVANHETDHVTILLGDGSAGFEPATQSPFRVSVDPHPHAVESVDLDGDGNLDLLVDDRNGLGIRVFRGTGGGRLDPSGMLIDVGGDPYIGMTVADVNGDGAPDIVTPNPRSLAVVLSAATSGFEFRAPAIVAADQPFGVKAGDFNADGLTDLVSVSGENSSTTQILLGDGQGGFSNTTNWDPIPLAGPKLAIVGDFNGDGIDDVAVACYRSSNVMLILGGPDGFETYSLPAGEHPWGLAAADFNGDGVDDLVIADDNDHNAVVFLSSP